MTRLCDTPLDISDNGFVSSDVICQLTLGKWPLLYNLDISENPFETLRWSTCTFGVTSDAVVGHYLHSFDYAGKLRFAGQFAHGQWPKLAALDLDLNYSSFLVCW